MGLATAIAAHSRGCKRIAVVDQARAFERAGGFINVNPNGVRALRTFAPNLADKLCAEVRGNSKRFKFCDVAGVDLNIGSLEGDNKEPNVGSTWYFVQKMLLDALPESIDLRPNTQLVALIQDEHGVNAQFVVNRIRANPFAHWGSDPAAAAARDEVRSTQNESQPEALTLRAGLVVGADGINSRVRAEVYRMRHGITSSSPQYSGFVSINATGHVPPTLGKVAEEVEKQYLQDGAVMTMIGCRAIRARLPDAPNVMLVRMRGESELRLGFSWKYIVHAAVPHKIALRKAESGGHGALVKYIIDRLGEEEFPNCMLQFGEEMLSSQSSATVVVRPLYIVPIANPTPFDQPSTASLPRGALQTAYGCGRLFLVGDSLHGMPPFISQGTSMGWEDVVELVDLLADALNWGGEQLIEPSVQLFDRVCEQYRAVREQRITLAQRETLCRRWAWDAAGFAEQQKLIRDYIPCAKGWTTNFVKEQ